MAMTWMQSGKGLRIACLVAVMSAMAELPVLAQVGPNGFRVTSQVSIRATPMQVYDALVDVSKWWSRDHTYSGDAANLSIEAKAGGCFCERLAGGGVEHMRVVYADRGATLRMSGALGPLQGMGLAGSLTFALKPAFGGTTLDLVYSVGGFSEGGFLQLAPAVNAVLTEQIERLKSYVETGRPAR